MPLNAGKTTISSAVPVVLEQIARSFDGQHVLILIGRAMPYRPLDFQQGLRASKQEYQGNPEATLNILGVGFDNTTWRGKWKTRFLADAVPAEAQNIFDAAAEKATQIITSPLTGAGEPVSDFTGQSQAVAEWDGNRLKTAGEVLEKMLRLQRDGIPLKVSWDNLARIGVILNFKFPHDRREDIDWEIEWMWSGDAIPTKIATPAEQDLSQFPEGLLDAVQNFRKLVTGPARFVKAVLDAVNQDIDLIESCILELSGIVTDYTDLAADALETLQNAMGVVDTVRLAWARIGDSLDTASAEWCATTDDFNDVAAAAGYKTEAKSAAMANAAAAGAIWETLAGQLEPAVQESFVMPANMDLRGVSNKFYGNPDNWRDIADFNMIEGTQVEAGMTILIPHLPKKL